MSGDLAKLQELFQDCNLTMSTTCLQNNARTQKMDGRVAFQKGVKSRPERLKDYAERVLRAKHIGKRDPDDPDQWLIEPNSRTYTGHTERYRDDLVYARQCRDKGVVDVYGKLTHCHIEFGSA